MNLADNEDRYKSRAWDKQRKANKLKAVMEKAGMSKELVCYNCGKKGHFASVCKDKKRKGKPKQGDSSEDEGPKALVARREDDDKNQEVAAEIK